jgi:3'-5' exoribonuclease
MLNDTPAPGTARESSPIDAKVEPRGQGATKLLLEFEPGERFRGTFLLRQITGKKTRAGKDYLSLEIGDRSGFLPGKVWDASPALLASLRVDHVDVEGDIETYNDKRQCRIMRIEPTPGEVDPLQFLPKTPLDVRGLFNRLAQIHRDIKSPYLRRLIKGFLGDENFRRRFLLAPAARNHHHPYLGGLLEHVVSLTEACCRIADAYPSLDRDILIAGAFFHDIGKVEELTVSPRIEF